MISQPTNLFAPQALLPGADPTAAPVLADNVVLELDPAGQRIAAVTPGAQRPPGALLLPGLVVPGLTNLHCHAFQRAMAGLAERAGPAGDTFWTWREVMYRFLGALSPEDVEAIAAQLYAELLTHGYTAVVEFHYLHRQPDGSAYADPAVLSHSILAAAAAAGIGLTLAPVLYQTSTFGGLPPSPGQRRFILEDDAFATLIDTLVAPVAAAGATLAIAPHSLRAVTPQALGRALAVRAQRAPGCPVHIHVAEQLREVEDCLAWSGQRPIAWLLDHQPVDEHWCLIHATHAMAEEAAGIARAGAVVGLCPTTEANLGDGVFPLPRFLEAGGRYGVGSDSNVSVSPADELRLVEGVRRLQTLTRNAAHQVPAGGSIGRALLSAALAGGAQASGRPSGVLAAGARADLVVLDPDHPALAGRTGTQILDAWMLTHLGNPVAEVWVGGRRVVADGRHVQAATLARRYRQTMAGLATRAGLAA